MNWKMSQRAKNTTALQEILAEDDEFPDDFSEEEYTPAYADDNRFKKQALGENSIPELHTKQINSRTSDLFDKRHQNVRGNSSEQSNSFKDNKSVSVKKKMKKKYKKKKLTSLEENKLLTEQINSRTSDLFDKMHQNVRDNSSEQSNSFKDNKSVSVKKKRKKKLTSLEENKLLTDVKRENINKDQTAIISNSLEKQPFSIQEEKITSELCLNTSKLCIDKKYIKEQSHIHTMKSKAKIPDVTKNNKLFTDEEMKKFNSKLFIKISNGNQHTEEQSQESHSKPKFIYPCVDNDLEQDQNEINNLRVCLNKGKSGIKRIDNLLSTQSVVLHKTDAMCVNKVAELSDKDTVMWFINFLCYKDMQNHYKYLQRCVTRRMFGML